MIPVALCAAIGSSAALARDDFCTSMEMLIVLAHDDFEYIDKGPLAPGSLSHRTSLVLPGASSCDILRSGWQAGYWCNWSSTPQSVTAQTRALGDVIGECFGVIPEWSEEEGSLSAFIEEGGVEFYINGSHSSGSFGIDISVELVADRSVPQGLDDARPIIATTLHGSSAG